MHISFLKTYFAHILNKNDIHSIKNAICHVCLKVTKYVYSGASFIRTLWFPVKIVQIGEASGYLKCYDLSLKKKS